DAFLTPVATELPADQVARFQRRNGFQDLDLFIADRFAVSVHRRLHSKVGQDLEEMVLNHVADRAGFIVERTPALDAEVLSHRDLQAFDVMAVPERLQERILEAKEDHVMHWPLTQVMVDAEDRLLVKGREQDPIEFLRRGEVMSKRLLDDHAGSLGAASPG